MAFTEKELKVAEMKLKGLMNKEIANKIGVSEADISQTLSRLRRKINTVKDSSNLLIEMKLIQEGPKYVMTEKGRELANKSKRTPVLISEAKAPKVLIAKPLRVRAISIGNFEVQPIEESSVTSEPILFRSLVIGRKKNIVSAKAVFDVGARTLSEKTIEVSPTSEPSQHIGFLSTRTYLSKISLRSIR